MSDRPALIVTGSSGLLGEPVCLGLAEAGYTVYAFDRVGLPEPPKHHEHVHDLECDLTDYNTVKGAVERIEKKTGGKLASVVHMAAYYDFSGEDSPLYRKVTIEGTDRLLNALSDFDLEQFVFTSTMLVHAPCEVGEHITEDDPLKAKWPYPESKIETERLIREGHPNVPSVFLRIGGVYTDYGRQPTLVQQIKRIHEEELESYVYPGNREAGQSAVHVDDAVESILLTVEKRSEIESKTAILIGEPDPPSYEELQNRIGQLIHGEKWKTIKIPKTVAKAGAAATDFVSGGGSFIKPFMVDMADDHYALDISRAKQLLGWSPKHSLMDTLPKMIDKLKADPAAWRRQNGLQP